MTYRPLYNAENAKEELKYLKEHYKPNSDLEFEPLIKLIAFLHHPNFMNFKNSSMSAALQDDFEILRVRSNHLIQTAISEIVSKLTEEFIDLTEGLLVFLVNLHDSPLTDGDRLYKFYLDQLENFLTNLAHIKIELNIDN